VAGWKSLAAGALRGAACRPVAAVGLGKENGA
jgi:hypothetical protein